MSGAAQILTVMVAGLLTADFAGCNIAAADPDISAPCSAKQFQGEWRTYDSAAMTFGADGTAHRQNRSAGRSGTWSYRLLTAVPGQSLGDRSDQCVLWLRWTTGGVSGQAEWDWDPPLDVVYLPTNLTATSVDLQIISDDTGTTDTWKRLR